MSIDRFFASFADIRVCARNVSVSWLPMVKTGSSAVIGSWNTMEIREPRSDRPAPRPLPPPSSSSPCRRIDPLMCAVRGSSRPMVASAVTDFPLPLSPTRPKTSPGSMVRSMPFTIGIVASGFFGSEKDTLMSDMLSTLMAFHPVSMTLVNFGLPSRFGW